MLKVFRIFFGGYEPNHTKLQAIGYVVAMTPKPIITVLNTNQGLGQIKGFTQKKGVIYPGVEVSAFKRSDKTHLWTVRSKQDGSYAFRNIAAGLECFVVGFDPEQNYNAVISDKVVAK
ncbi:carboxypeptidase regulatory-like domain-containing protein [Acinetobacter sp. ANC 4945]|uniref:Carboxypeptidase regulatory-like domain-containing protein n=1 Tax=Acinetobacter amyesii TaxID=2942470 RepID=A0A1T1GUK5_9GAMM|nr:hypothetical protein [Acinetobacter amyesii]MCL6248043.1 carboxypeptidase regulatory-like domain-containing protein [Acinetobacter amyesii]OOV81248.1 hypothetical protein B1202_11875 [Acinetobacter amyesii]